MSDTDSNKLQLEESGGMELSELRKQNDDLLESTSELEERLKMLMKEHSEKANKDQGPEVKSLKQKIEHLSLEKDEAGGLVRLDEIQLLCRIYQCFLIPAQRSF